MWSMIRGETGRFNFLVEVISNRREKLKFLGLQRDPPNSPLLVGHSDLPISKILRTVLGLVTVKILKRVKEGIFFQGNKFTACIVKDLKIGCIFFDEIQSTESCPSISR